MKVKAICNIVVAYLFFGMAGAVFAETTVIHAGHIIVEPGKPILENYSIIVENDKITAIKPGFVEGDKTVDLKGAYVLPGLIDMHTHVTLSLNLIDPTASILRAGVGRIPPLVFASLPRVQQVLHNGFTTIRNLGDPASITYDLRDAINQGIIEGPRILASEPQFNVSGGDYDAFSFGVKPEAEHFFENRGTCDGAIDCRRAVREEIHRGAGVIKLRMAGLGFMDNDIGAIEYEDEINAIVDTAHKLNRTVAAHSNSKPEGNRLIIMAGVDSIEHGPVAEAEVKLMKEHGVALTPTLIANETAKSWMDAIKAATGRDVYQETIDGAKNAYNTGVMIVYGTDLGLFGPEKQLDEFELLVKQAGMTPTDALKAATINAATVLNMQDKIGSLKDGKFADIIAVSGNPLADISAMKKIKFVMKAGKVYKDDNISK
ncbi:amidohydrolase family protein [Kordiimonas pumila]|uniref:Amidohydrolase family protein n=1 Tax=Kordiimonas pumila TaxID=2161677 RepID=A0ABV7D910_9PROT|nr:amidohydrolase family protein [Kordiimonas pumila]